MVCVVCISCSCVSVWASTCLYECVCVCVRSGEISQCTLLSIYCLTLSVDCSYTVCVYLFCVCVGCVCVAKSVSQLCTHTIRCWIDEWNKSSLDLFIHIFERMNVILTPSPPVVPPGAHTQCNDSLLLLFDHCTYWSVNNDSNQNHLWLPTILKNHWNWLHVWCL